MRLHTDVLTRHDILAAAGAQPDVYVYAVEYGSRSHERSFDIALRGGGERHTRRPNSGKYGADSYEYAATWSDWGRFLAAIFEADPTAKTPYYSSAADFHGKTEGLFNSHVEVTPELLADEVRELHRRAPNCGRTQPIGAVANRRGLSPYTVSAAIFGE